MKHLVSCFLLTLYTRIMHSTIYRNYALTLSICHLEDSVLRVIIMACIVISAAADNNQMQEQAKLYACSYRL